MKPELLMLLALVAVATAILLMPLARYLIVGWSAKRADILDGLNDASRTKYFAMFCRSEASNPSPGDMEGMYVRWYGRRLFLAPASLLLIVCIISSYLALGAVFRAQSLLDATFVPLDIHATGVSAVAGAYLWVVDDFISRTRRLDFSPADIHWAVLRLAVSVPMGYSFAVIASESAGPFVAFAIGAFPLATLTKMLRRLAATRLGYDDIGVAGSDAVVKLQGVNNAIADRLANEDITTITQVAYCDPIRLTMRSNLTFNVVTDLMNQAIAWEYIDEGMDKIRKLGLRGAVEIKHVLNALKDAPGTETHTRADLLIKDVATALAQSEPTVINVFHEIAEDPFTDYLDSIWD